MYASDLHHTRPALAEKLQSLYALSRGQRMELGFRPAFLQLLEAYGNPQLNLPPVIHIAGTNGKGSTLAFLRAILEAAGLSVHCFTSPHLIEFNERVVIGGQKISNTALEKYIDEALCLNENRDITFFEITTALAFAAFSRHPADICLIEVGLGGRLDCTNVIPAPLMSLITKLSFDHTEFLGETIEDIAREKGGIIKPRALTLLGQQNPDYAHTIQQILEHIAHSQGSLLLQAGSDWVIDTQTDHMRFKSASYDMRLPLPALTGFHQSDNAGLAIQAALSMPESFAIKPDHIQRGLLSAHWPARLQRLKPENYGLPDSFELWLDGGHNQDAAQALARQAQTWREQDDLPLIIVAGMMAHKNPADFLNVVMPFALETYAVDIEGEPHSQRSEAIVSILPEVKALPSVLSALRVISTNEHPPARILICGSLYLAGQVLKASQNKP